MKHAAHGLGPQASYVSRDQNIPDARADPHQTDLTPAVRESALHRCLYEEQKSGAKRKRPIHTKLEARKDAFEVIETITRSNCSNAFGNSKNITRQKYN